jgi:hypothetical protein
VISISIAAYVEGSSKRGVMRWFRLGSGRRQVQHDPGRQAALLQDARQRFGPHAAGGFAGQADALARLLDGADGLAVAVEIIREFADAAHAELLAQAADLHQRTGYAIVVDRHDYRRSWQAAGDRLRWTLFALPGGLFSYVHVAAAAAVIGDQARRIVRTTDADPVLTHVFEVLDLTVTGWEFGRVRVDTDAAALAGRLIATARQLRDAMGGDPPPLPPPVREAMRRNNTIDVYDPAADRITGTIDPGRQMRESLLA